MKGTKNREEIRLKGLPLSGGMALARVCLFNEKRHHNLPDYKVQGRGIEWEKKRFQKAEKIAHEQLENLKAAVQSKIGKAEAEIFVAQKMILGDQSIHERILKNIEENKMNAEKAILSALDFFESRILQLDNEYLKERASDIGEVKRRLLDILSNMNPAFQCAGEEHCQRGRRRIVVARELTPSLTMELDAQHTWGFVTERGGAGSHAAILARALGIPAVSGIKNIHSRIYCGTDVLVNGTTGEVVIWPSPKTLARFPELERSRVDEVKAVPPIAGLQVMANISLAQEVKEALNFQAEGIGLYRTEFEFLAAGKLLTEEEQLERYVSVIHAMNGKAVYFRLLDIGGDKTAPFFDLAREENPYLGFRGSRLLLGRRDFFRTQARALARASEHGPVFVMYPMIVELEQFLKLKQIFVEAAAGIPVKNVKHGVMFEVPSACFQAGELLKVSDFASIGTNDLIQYFFAVDRNNELVAYDYNPDRKVFWSLIQDIAAAAVRAGKPLSVCGEMAGNPDYVKRFLKCGIKSVSVSPKLIPALRLGMQKN